MIVYYDENSNSILGLSHRLDVSRTEKYFETDDPVAERIFLGKEKSLHYVAVPGRYNRGILKLKSQTSRQGLSISDKIFKIPTNISNPELMLTFIADEHILELELLEDSAEWWRTSLPHRKLHLIISHKGDPYMPIWSQAISHTDLVDNRLLMPCTLDHEFDIFTVKLFDSYKHETKSSRN
jgi:hypothetical protein